MTAPASQTTSIDSFGARGKLTAGDTEHEVFRLSAIDGAQRLPYSLKILPVEAWTPGGWRPRLQACRSVQADLNGSS